MIQVIKKTIDYIEEHIKEKLNIEQLAKEVNSSYRNLERAFLQICKCTISEYYLNRKISIIANELINTNKKIYEIALEYGYKNYENLSKIFSKKCNVSPQNYRKQRKNKFVFEKINTNDLFDIKKYTFIYNEVETIESITLYRVKCEIINGFPHDSNIIKNNINEIVRKSKENINEIYETFYVIDNKNKYIYGNCIKNELNNNDFNKFEKIELPQKQWFVCIGKSEVSYEDARELTLASIYLLKLCEKIYQDYGYYQDLEFSEKYKINNICINKGFKKEENAYFCEVWIPLKEDFFIEKNCNTCDWCVPENNKLICCGNGKNIEGLIQKFPKGCESFKYSYNYYIENEEIREKKAREIFEERFFYKIISF